MTQLEKVLMYFEEVTRDLRETTTDSKLTNDLKELREGIERGEITADTLISEHRHSKGIFGSDWHLEDIKDVSEEELTDEEVRMVADNIEHFHDAEIGINWEVIEYHIDHVISRRLQLSNYGK